MLTISIAFSKSAKRRKIENLSVTPENMGSILLKLKVGRKFVCIVRGWVGKQVGGVQ